MFASWQQPAQQHEGEQEPEQAQVQKQEQQLHAEQGQEQEHWQEGEVEQGQEQEQELGRGCERRTSRAPHDIVVVDVFIVARYDFNGLLAARPMLATRLALSNAAVFVVAADENHYIVRGHCLCSDEGKGCNLPTFVWVSMYKWRLPT